MKWSGLLGLAISLAICVAGSDAQVISIQVEGKAQQGMTYGLDLEPLEEAEQGAESAALWAIEHAKPSFIRVGIRPERDAGKVDAVAYGKQLKLLAALAEKHPAVEIVASPMQQTGEPAKPDLAILAGSYARYVRFLDENGCTLTYLDPLNRVRHPIDPATTAKLMRQIEQGLDGASVPLLIAPSSATYADAAGWLAAANASPDKVKWMITSIAGAQDRKSVTAFSKQAAAANKPVWNTRSFDLAGTTDQTRTAMRELIASIRDGVSGVQLRLSVSDDPQKGALLVASKTVEPNRAFSIFSKLAQTSQGGYRLISTEADGISTMTFRHDRQGVVAVWVLSERATPVDVVIQVRSFFVGPTQVMSWGPDDGPGGKVVTEGLNGESSLQYRVNGKSLYCFTFHQLN